MRARGWTLHEMLISLAIMGVVTALAAHAAVAQLRFFQGVSEITAVRSQVAEVGAIVSAVVWGVVPADGEVLVAEDSALEVDAPAGVAVVCAGGTGGVTIAAPRPDGNTLASMDASPESGDAARVFIADSSGATWLNVTIASSPAPGPACAGFAAAVETLQLQLREPLVIPVGAVLRWTRRMRLSVYRASDSRWYLGIREWNVESLRFNTIQPVAGPVLPYSADPAKSGLRFAYGGVDGVELSSPLDAARIATISVITRAEAKRPVRMPGRVATTSTRYLDSSVVTVALRNAP